MNIFSIKGIEEKVFKIVGDQGSNVKKAFKETVSKDGYSNLLNDMLNIDDESIPNDETDEIIEESETSNSKTTQTNSSHYLCNVSDEREEEDENDTINDAYLDEEDLVS